MGAAADGAEIVRLYPRNTLRSSRSPKRGRRPGARRQAERASQIWRWTWPARTTRRCRPWRARSCRRWTSACRVLERDVALLLVKPKDKDENASAILEVRAGTGGDEAALFAGDLFRMYSRYATTRGWRVEIDSVSDGEKGGYKEIIASITGDGVFGRLKFESGVHRVQRVPDTGNLQGRIQRPRRRRWPCCPRQFEDVEDRDQ